MTINSETGRQGVEQYPFDPSLRPEDLEGLDRLRCVSDRAYAATLYDLYLLAERNEAQAKRKQQRHAQVAEHAECRPEPLHQLALQALAGELGPDAKDIARCVVADVDGNVRKDHRALNEFGRVLDELEAI